MNEQDAFLEALRERPADRKIYHDWLSDQPDEKLRRQAELMELETQMEKEPWQRASHAPAMSRAQDILKKMSAELTELTGDSYNRFAFASEQPSTEINRFGRKQRVLLFADAEDYATHAEAISRVFPAEGICIELHEAPSLGDVLARPELALATLMCFRNGGVPRYQVTNPEYIMLGQALSAKGNLRNVEAFSTKELDAGWINLDNMLNNATPSLQEVWDKRMDTRAPHTPAEICRKAREHTRI